MELVAMGLEVRTGMRARVGTMDDAEPLGPPHPIDDVDVRMTGDASTATLRAFELFLESCRYQPALKDGKPVNMRLRQDLSVHAK